MDRVSERGAQGRVRRLKPPPLCVSFCAHSAAWQRRQYGNHFALMHFSGLTRLTVSRDSRSPEISLMKIMGVHRSLERDKQRERERGGKGGGGREGEEEMEHRSYRPL